MILQNNFFRKILYIIIFSIFLSTSYKSFQSNIFSIHFVDEDENIIAGYYITKGEKLYANIFSHKQPLPAVISMASQQITKPNSLYLLVKRHREIIYFYSTFFSLILIATYGLPALIFAIIIEIVKTFLLGNLFLSESLVIFPLAYVFGHIWNLYHNVKRQNNWQEKIKDNIFYFSLALIPYLMFILIPFVIFIIIILLISKKITKKLLFTFSFSLLALFLVCFPFVDYSKYLENTFNAVKSLYWGGTSSEGWTKVFYLSFLRPIAAIIEMKKSDFSLFQGILSIGCLLSLIYLFIAKKSYRIPLLTIYFSLGLLSLRVVYLDQKFYGGFHGLPWLSAFLFVTIYQIIEIAKIKKRFRFLILGFVLIFSALIIYFGKFMIAEHYRRADRERDWYVNFSRLYDFGQTIRILSKPGDKLMVLPAEQLIYWQSSLPHASRFLYVYMFTNPIYKKELYNYWEKTPPQFLYDEHNMDLFKKWQKDYIRVKRENYDTPLFIGIDKAKSLEEWQLNEIKRMKFSIPNLGKIN